MSSQPRKHVHYIIPLVIIFSGHICFPADTTTKEMWEHITAEQKAKRAGGFSFVETDEIEETERTERTERIGLKDAALEECLKVYLHLECNKHFARRKAEVAAIKTTEGVKTRQATLRKAWFEAIGKFPDKTPLNPKVTGTIKQDGYRIEKVLYESRPQHHVTAALYLPNQGEPPFPGVLVPCGHHLAGKACEAYQSICIDLVRNGFVVLCYDPIGQGERIQTLDEKGKRIIWGTTEHTLVDIGARLCGGGVAAYRIWDGIRSIDYLISRPEVDPERIGCTGNSGGGTMTSYLMISDDRIYAAAPSCYITSLERLFATIGPQDGEQNITGQVARGIEHADYLLMRAPKPTLVLTATQDFFDIEGSWTSFRETKRLYNILGFGERLDFMEYPDKHGFSKPRREAALRWLSRWLKNDDRPLTEKPHTICTAAELQVTQTGQVLHDLEGVSAWDLNLKQAQALAADRSAFWEKHSMAECRNKIRNLLAVGDCKRMWSKVSHGGRWANFDTDDILKNKVPLETRLYYPFTKDKKAPCVIYVDSRGKNYDDGPDGDIDKWNLAGYFVLAIDVRGFGETAPVKPRKIHDNEYQRSYMGIHLGRPLLGQRVADVLSVLDAVMTDKIAYSPEKKHRIDKDNLIIVGIEKGGPIALHAAFLSEKFKHVVLWRSIASWMDVVKTPLCTEQLDQIVPLALRYYDLPDLIRAIGQEKVKIGSPLDPAGKPK